VSIHPGIYRARLGVVVAALASLVALVCWFPLGELLHQRGDLSTLSAQVNSVAASNATLRADVRSLNQNGTIETIAHEEFGLVKPGQISFVIEPAAGSTTGAPGLAPTPIAPSDLVADQPVVAPQAGSSAPSGPNFWSRFISRLAFWRHAR
jgi:cell division protein FtsB